ncbi:MAG: hypothetical protein K2K84_02925, partial [Muribaculaceae bacterium]|nr:hypothetical protein [Muribaculaceae bacterium]
DNLRRFGLTKGWKLFACIAVNYLGVPPEKMPLYDPAFYAKSERIFDEILQNGNFGYYSKAYARTPLYGHGIWHVMGKARNIFGYYFDLFPLIPVEATFLLFFRATAGTAEYTERAVRYYKKKFSSTASTKK